jgi:hypothetical protein
MVLPSEASTPFQVPWKLLLNQADAGTVTVNANAITIGTTRKRRFLMEFLRGPGAWRRFVPWEMGRRELAGKKE